MGAAILSLACLYYLKKIEAFIYFDLYIALEYPWHLTNRERNKAFLSLENSILRITRERLNSFQKESYLHMYITFSTT